MTARAALTKPLLVKAGLADILSGILKVASEGIVVADGGLRILLFGKGAEAIFGYKASEAVGQSVNMLLAPARRLDHRGFARQSAGGFPQGRCTALGSDVLGLRKDGTVFPLEVGISRVTTPSGQIYTAVLRDASEQRWGEEANAADAAKSAFLATMSHEIRTPLNGVLGMAQAMAADDLPPRQRDRLEVIRQSGESLLATLNDLLDLSTIEAGKLDLENREFDMTRLAQAAQATFSAAAAAKGLAFDLKIVDHAQGVYRGDALRVRQVLHNLISNALKFTDKGGVRVVVGRKSGVLTLVVRDTGIGIAPHQAALLFRKFEQGDATTTRRYGGAGLGLAICRDLAELMGGSIAVDSSPGGGAVFTVTLPLVKLVQAPPRPDEPSGGAPAATAPAALRVLVAEDNAINQTVLKTLLNQAGIEPVIVPDGRSAVAAWEREPWDIILMDVQMPEMDGSTAAALIRSREAAEGRRRTPIVALTANAQRHQVVEYKQAGMDELVPKPIEIEKLFAAIATLTG